MQRALPGGWAGVTSHVLHARTCRGPCMSGWHDSEWVPARLCSAMPAGSAANIDKSLHTMIIIREPGCMVPGSNRYTLERQQCSCPMAALSLSMVPSQQSCSGFSPKKGGPGMPGNPAGPPGGDIPGIRGIPGTWGPGGPLTPERSAPSALAQSSGLRFFLWECCTQCGSSDSLPSPQVASLGAEFLHRFGAH